MFEVDQVDRKLGVYSIDHEKSSGCSYYRLKVPLRTMQKLGIGEFVLDKSYGDPKEQRHIAALTSDIILIYALSGAGITATMESIKSMNAGWNDSRTEKIYPPSFVFDMDDNVDWVHPFNEAFIRLGTRDYAGRLLKPGDILTTRFEKDGAIVPLWEDKKTVRNGELFDIQRNLTHIAEFHQTARRCDAVTVPSPALAKYYKETVQCSDVYVFPNSMIPEDYPKARLAPRDDGSIRILWQGGGSHMVDWFPLREAIRTIALKYPQVKFVIWGTAFKWIHDHIPEDQMEYVEWVEYDGYKAHRVMIDADINLCPLVENQFNVSKSAIKWYESTMPYRPEATLAAKVAPYSDEIVDGETGLLYESPDDFVAKLSCLIENADLRARLGEQAKAWVLANRHAEKTVPGLVDFYKSLRARKALALEV